MLNLATLSAIALDAPARPAAKTAGQRFAYAGLAMETLDPDLALVRLAQSGDQRAFEALLVKYQRRIARHVARYIRRASDVEDVVQDTFIRAYRGLASFRGDSAFYSWLYRIATNVALTALKRDPNPVLLGEDAPEERADAFEPGISDNEDPERKMIASQIADAVEKAISRLQPTLSEALMLFEVEGKTYPEIAQMLGIPVGTVRTRIFRAREFIAKRLEPLLGPHRSRRW
ncbi:MAG: sigma-70 family RNA polymerase sigma factor [Betaproteobacteria bacterium]